MKNLTLLLLVTVFLFQSCEDKNNLENTLWKSCGDDCVVTDVMAFNGKYLYMKNDSIYLYENDSLIALVDTITYHYGERRLYVKNLKYGCIARYCEQ